MGRMKLKTERDWRRMGRQKYLMTNLVYDDLHINLFVENHLRTLLDPTNLPALKAKYDLEYLIVTDEDGYVKITRHPNFMALTQVCEVNIFKLQWSADVDKFGSRYGLLAQVCNESIKRALALASDYPNPQERPRPSDMLSIWVADIVFAKECLPRMMSHMERGHDSVLMVPIRSAADSVNQVIMKMPGAPTDLELFEVAYRNLHHLWIACLHDNPMYTRMPYSMLWNSRTGLLAHNFGITPIIFRPSIAMKAVERGIDSDITPHLKNPHWCTDWTDAPVAGVEPLSNGHYPPFDNAPMNLERIAMWAKGKLPGMPGPAIHPAQVENLPHPLFYPSEKTFNNPALAEEAALSMVKLRAMLDSNG